MKFDEDINPINYNNANINPNYSFSGMVLYSYCILFLPKYSQYSLLLTSYSYNSNRKYCDHYLPPENFNPNIYDVNEKANSYSLNSDTQVTTTIKDQDSQTIDIDNYHTEISTYNTETELIEESGTFNTDNYHTEISTYNSLTE